MLIELEDPDFDDEDEEESCFDSSNDPADSKLEYEADALIRLVKAYKGEYPARSERDLLRNVRRAGSQVFLRSGEISLSQLILKSEDGKELPDTPLDYALPLWGDSFQPGTLDPYVTQYQMELSIRRRIKWEIANADLTPRQRLIMDLYADGLSLRDIEKKLGVSKSAVGREIQVAKAKMEESKQQDFERIEKYMQQRYEILKSADRERMRRINRN